jgi:hypothetical protein
VNSTDRPRPGHTPAPPVAAFLATHGDMAVWPTADFETVEHLIETTPAPDGTGLPTCHTCGSGSGPFTPTGDRYPNSAQVLVCPSHTAHEPPAVPPLPRDPDAPMPPVARLNDPACGECKRNHPAGQPCPQPPAPRATSRALATARSTLATATARLQAGGLNAHRRWQLALRADSARAVIAAGGA